MHLKNLTVFGFKSFADKTALDFQPGITAIVGPNGCGKSNIADAIRWVLGEQSAKALRGGEMADVIFNGADSRKQLNLAEVSLTIGGVDVEELKTAGVPLEYDEITLTRRVSRDGGSNYYLNRTPCRLKDIQQLFAGTGVGRSSYSIMAQGNITQILSSRPEDRRMVFEEAAGITRFKVQKKEALRKLEHTEQNLLRVADLVREVKRQIISLQRQAGKARRYQKLMGELQHLETQLARHQYDVLMAETQERQERIERLRRDIEATSEAVLKAEGELGGLRHRHSELEHDINARHQRALGLKAEVEQHESRIQFNERRLEELESRNAEALAEIQQSEARRIDAEQELTTLAGQLESAQAELESRQDEQAAKRAVVQSIEAELRTAQETVRQLNNDVFRTAQDVSRLRNQVSALELQKQSNLTRLDRLSTEKVQLEEERRQTARRLEEFARDSATQAASVRSRRLTLEERQEQLRGAQQRLEELGKTLEEVHREQASGQSRLSVLEQLESGLEGFGAGAQAALKTGVQVLGTLAQRIHVPDRDVIAIEAALGHHLQLVLAGQPQAAREILAALASQKKGRASIAALSLWNGDANPPGNSTLAEEHRAVLEQHECRAALGVLRADETVDLLVRSLLQRTHIAPDLERATAAWEATRGQLEFVTPQGEMLSRHGVFTGGASNGSDGKATSILGRKNEIAALQAKLAGLGEQAGSLGRERGAAQADATALQAGLQQDRTELQAEEVALAGRQGEHNALQHAERLLGQKIDTVLYEISSLRDQQREGEEKRTEASRQLHEMEERETALNREAQEQAAAIDSAREQRDEALAALTAASVEVAKREENRAALAQRKQPLERRIAELRELVAQRRQQIETVLQRRSEATAEIEESRGRIGALRHERDQVITAADGLETERQQAEDDIQAREQTLRDERGRLTRSQEQRGTLDVEVAQKQVSVQNLVERIQQKYHLDLSQVPGEALRIIYADEGPIRVETVSTEELETAGASTDWNVVAEQVAALQKRIEDLGPVNLVAIEEYEETEQRHKFLSEQHDDLVEAKRQLSDLITRINQQTREMFAETFEKIRANFRELFAEVFGGGKADLQLVDQENILESGIDIVARPPGKQLQSIRLLSGGEQTMTAVALLFAIYQVRPSPFCVLDELDAPLDEANINRFIRVLQRFLEKSQFIIVTHNKRTIGMADAIYGVTMQERGVSKVMSMKFQQVGDNGANGNGNGNGSGHENGPGNEGSSGNGGNGPNGPDDHSQAAGGNGNGNGKSGREHGGRRTSRPVAGTPALAAN